MKSLLRLILLCLATSLFFILSSCAPKCEHTNVSKTRENETPATCTAKGSYEEVGTCVDCGKEIFRKAKTVSKTNHSPAEAVRENGVESTCKAEGSFDEVIYCETCHEEISRVEKTIDKSTEHTPNVAVRENEIKATCKDEGSFDEVIYCEVCEAELSRVEKTIDKLTEHTPDTAVRENEVEASCKKEGSYDEVIYCKVCEAELSRVEKTIDKSTKHTPVTAVRENEVEASCKKEGSYDEVTYCKVCEAELSRVEKTIDKSTEHTPDTAVREKVVEATCKKEGSYDEVTYCKVCEAELSREEKEIQKKPHSPSEWIVDKEASGKEDGLKHRDCTECGDKYDEAPIPATGKHTPGEWVIEKEASCKEEGLRVKYCEECGEAVEEEPISVKKEHTPDTAVRENEVEASCKKEGSYDEVTYCKICEAELSRVKKTIDKSTEHTPDTAVRENVVEATCKKEGSYDEVTYCKVCEAELSRTPKVIEKSTKHTPDTAVRENEVEATCKKEGSYDEVTYCKLCGAEASRIKKTIDKLKTHTEVTDKAVEPTCQKEGLTEGKHCSVCDLIIVKQEILPKEKHNFKDKVCTACGAIDYQIEKLTANGADIKDYAIYADDASQSSALKLRDIIYEKSGYYLKSTTNQNTTKAIIVKCVTQSNPAESFKVSVASNGKITILCSYAHMLDFAMTHFIEEVLDTASGVLDFSGTVYTEDVTVIYYEDFGAVGDGKTNDFEAMYNVHTIANKYGQTVKARPDSIFYIKDTYISGAKKSIEIRTNTDWQGAKIIIDDSEIGTYAPYNKLQNNNIFVVKPDEKMVTVQDKALLEAIAVAGVNPGTTHIDFKLDGWGGALMLVPYNSTHKVARRRGYSGHSGSDMHEIVIIDQYGNVSSETPIMFDYTSVTKMEVYKLDPKTAITIKNATIETIDSKINHMVNGSFVGGYISRGLQVERSYTTVENIKHVVIEGFTLKDRVNGEVGPSSGGMFKAQNASYITFKNCIIPGRQAYGGSSYNFRPTLVNKVVLENCTQSNFWILVDPETGAMTPSADYVDGAYPSMSTVAVYNNDGVLTTMDKAMHWGIGGGNYCKNMEFINSKISRFDAHTPLYNGKIINSSLNGMELTGYGTLEITNTDWYQYGTTTPLLYLRADYGYHWDGDIVVTNTRGHIYNVSGTNPSSLTLCHYNYVNWYFGYTCAFPNVTLDNFDLYYIKSNQPIQSFTVNLIKTSSNYNRRMHESGNIGVASIFDYIDADKDGYIDEPRGDFDRDGKIDEPCDLDGNGVIGNTSITMESLAGKSKDTLQKGISHPTCKVNLNPVKPPDYFKVINNDGVDGKGQYTYRVPNSYKSGDGGFFGNTKFIYGTGKNDYFLGTNYTAQTKTKTFKFYN